MLLSNAKLEKQATTQEDKSFVCQMTGVPLTKKAKGAMLKQSIHTDKSSIMDGVANNTQAETSANSSVSASKGSGKVPLAGLSTKMNTHARDILGKSSKPSGRGLLPVTHKQGLRASYTQPAVSSHILLEEPKQLKHRKVEVFSSQKTPQPFLDR